MSSKTRSTIATAEYISEPAFNQYAEDITEQIDNSLNDYILPHRISSTKYFSSADAKLYVSKRRNTGETSKGKSSLGIFGYEELLFNIFWARGYERRKLIFLSGTIGCGKSTLLDYFLRCYCAERLKDVDSFEQKLNIQIDFKGATSREEFYLKFLIDLRLSLETNGIYQDFKDIFDSSKDKDERVIEVLQSISSNMRMGKIGYKYLTICFDNIDQSPNEVQHEAISLAQDLIEEKSKIEIHKIFFPLWPQTIVSFLLRNQLKLSGAEYREIRIPHPDLKLLTRKRIRKLFRLLNDLEGSGRQDVKKFIKTINYKIDDMQRKFLFDLSYNNIKLMAILYTSIVKSASIAKYQRQYSEIRKYQFIDSLVCGISKTHNHAESLIMNPFYNVANPSKPTHSLVVYYLLYYLNAQQREQSEVISFFVGIGFTGGLVEEAIQRLDQRHVLHLDKFADSSVTLHIHNKVRNAYVRLINEPAALDNWAQTTPIFDNKVEGRHPTVGYKDSDFRHRVENTLIFLDFLAEEDDAIHSCLSAEKSRMVRDHVPMVRRQLSKNYLNRLQALRKRGLPYDPKITAIWWENVIGKLQKNVHQI